jgi:hypothetical protein
VHQSVAQGVPTAVVKLVDSSPFPILGRPHESPVKGRCAAFPQKEPNLWRRRASRFAATLWLEVEPRELHVRQRSVDLSLFISHLKKQHAQNPMAQIAVKRIQKAKRFQHIGPECSTMRVSSTGTRRVSMPRRSAP